MVSAPAQYFKNFHPTEIFHCKENLLVAGSRHFCYNSYLCILLTVAWTFGLYSLGLKCAGSDRGGPWIRAMLAFRANHSPQGLGLKSQKGSPVVG